MPHFFDRKHCGNGTNYRSFQKLIDKRLCKANPAFSIPWKSLPRPHWVNNFRPKRIVDIGSAEAHYTSAVLYRLGEWGCLTELEEVILFDGDHSFSIDDNTASVTRAVDRCDTVLAYFGLNNVCVSFVNKTVQVEVKNTKTYLSADAYGEITADFLILSHLIYYFPKNRASLIKASLNAVGGSNGYLWLVVRNRECPIYIERGLSIRNGRKKDAHQLDFSDTVMELLRPSHFCRILDIRDLYSLHSDKLRLKDRQLIHNLMWRAEGRKRLAANYTQILTHLKKYKKPIFSERHFIIST